MNTSGQIPPAPKFRLKLNGKLMLFSLLLLPLLTGLGFWQLERAAEKRTIQESWRKQQALAPVPFEEITFSSQTDFRRVSLRGRFDAEHYWLLENRILDGNLGYEVLMPFYLASDSAKADLVLVNRGWVAAGAYRNQLPEFGTPAGIIRISGSLVEPSDNRFIKGNVDQKGEWPRKILEIDLESLGAQLQSEMDQTAIHNAVLQIDADNAAALNVHWQPINMTPSKHQGYAVQWFSMAFVLLILTIFANTNLADIVFRRQSDQRQ
jgi:surfeit locus 1 family protein